MSDYETDCKIRSLELELAALKSEIADYREALEKYKDIACVYGSMPMSEQFAARSILAKHDKHKGG